MGSAAPLGRSMVFLCGSLKKEELMAGRAGDGVGKVYLYARGGGGCVQSSICDC